MPIAESITAAIGSLKVLEICAGVIAKKAAGAGLDHALAFIKTTEFEDFPKNHDVAHAIHRAFCSSIQGMVAASEEAGDLEEDNSWRKDLADFARSNRLLILQVDTATVPYAELEQQIRKIYGNKDQAWKRISTDRMIEFVEGVVGRPLIPIFRKYFHEGGNDRPGWADQFELFFAEEIKTNERVFRILQYDRANELVALANEQIELLLKLHSLTKAEFSNLRLQIDEQTITIVTKIEDGITKVDDQLTDIKELIADKIGIEIRTKNLVVDPTPDNLPEGLYSANQPWFREDRVVALADMFDRKKGSRVLIGVIGAPGSGKTTLLQALAELIVQSDRPAGNLAVLYVDLTGALRPLRAIANALDSRFGAGQSALDEDGEPQSSDLAFIQNTIMGQIGRRNLLVVFEGVWEILAEDARLQELTEFLNSKAMQRAFQLLEFRGESLAAIPSAAKTELANYSQEQAVEFLVRLAQPQPRAQEAVELLAADYARLLQPGPLANATICFDPALTPDGAEPPTSFDLAEAIETEASELVCSMTVKLCKTEGFDPEAALLALQAMAVFGGREFPAAVRGAAKLELLPLAGLKQLGWVKDEARLIGFAIQALRASAELVLGGKSRRSSAADLRSTIVRLAEALLGNMQTRSSQTLDQALAWCERHAISQVQLIQGLMAMQLQESQADMVSVLNPAEEQKAAAEFLELGQRGDLEGALAALAIHTQNSATWHVKGQPHPKSEFVRRAQSVLDIVGQGTDLAGRQLNAFDTSLYFGSRKFHAFVEVGVLRQQVFDRLAQHEATAVASADQVWLSGWLSFLLNLADQNLSNGQKDIANGIAKRTATLLSSAMDWLAPAVKYRLLARFALQRERLAEGAQSARAALQEAVEHAVAAAAAAGPFDIGSFHYCLRVVQRMVAAENDEAARKAHVDQVRAAFVALLGETDGWPVGLRAQMAALMRQEAKRAWQLPYQKKRAEEALKLLQTSRPSGLFEVEGDPKASLVQARLQAFRGKREAALKSCNRSLDIIASPDAWSLKLRLLDEADKGVGDWINDPLLNGTGPDSTLPRDLSRAIKELRDWTKKDENTGQNYGDVLLWTIQREWRSEGSIERSVARKIETEAGRRYVTMPVEEKRELLKAAFTQRQDRLKRLAHKFGRSINIEFALADNQAQFVRSSAVIEHHEPDVASVFKIYDDALEQWPNNHEILFQKAEYLRYIWQTEAAIDAFRHVYNSATSGDLRRRAAFSLSRALHAAATFGELEELQRTAYLKEASRLISDLEGAVEHVKDVALLKDHIAVELGEVVDWLALDDMREIIIGSEYNFPTQLLQEFDKLKDTSHGNPANITQLLESSFADPDVLGLTGSLYTRRVEKGASNDQLKDCERAIGFICAAAVLERSWEGRERAVTNFRLGKAILSAAQARGTSNPISAFKLNGKADQLAWAESRFQSAADRSTGALRAVSIEHGKRTAQLRVKLAKDNSAE